MKSFDAAIIAELAKAEAMFCWLLDLELAATHRFTDLDVDIYVNGNKYAADAMALGSIAMAAGLGVSRVAVRVGNVDHAMGAVFLGEETRGRTAKIGFAALDADRQVLASHHPLWQGLISTYDINDNAVAVTLVNELVLWRKKTLRACTSSCPWPFKGAECAYSGAETWCDQTYDRCTDLGNTDQFGGFRWLDDLMEKEVWWGRNPK